MGKHTKVQRVAPAVRKARKIRGKIRRAGAFRLTVHRSSQHIYAQVFTPDGGKVLAAASSLEKEIKTKDFGAGKLNIATAIGKLIAKRAIEQGVKKVAFDRGRYPYHGRIKALADGARADGLEI